MLIRQVGLLLFVICALSLSLHQQDLIVGGYSKLDVNSLSEDAQQVDQYLRNIHKNINDATLKSASRQVVAGFNYRFIYQSPDGKQEWDFIVYKNLKGKLLQNGYTYSVTLPNGQKVKAIADPASAFLPKKTSKPKVSIAQVEKNTVSQRKADTVSFPNRIQPIEA